MKNNHVYSLMTLTAIALQMSSLAVASEVNATSVTSAGSTSAAALLEKISVHYFATFHGSPVGNISSPYTVDRTGMPLHKSAMNLDGELTTAYKLDSDLSLGAVVPVIYTPVLGQDASLGDIGMKLASKSTVRAEGFNLSTNLILQAPTSKYSRDRGMNLGIKTTPAVRYQFPTSRFTVGAWTEGKTYVGVTTGKAVKLWAEPYVNYQLSRSFSLNLGYEMETDHNVGTPTFDFTSYQTDLMPGFVWNITPHVMLNPYIQLFTGNRVTADTSAFGAVISASLL